MAEAKKQPCHACGTLLDAGLSDDAGSEADGTYHDAIRCRDALVEQLASARLENAALRRGRDELRERARTGERRLAETSASTAYAVRDVFARVADALGYSTATEGLPKSEDLIKRAGDVHDRYVKFVGRADLFEAYIRRICEAATGTPLGDQPASVSTVVEQVLESIKDKDLLCTMAMATVPLGADVLGKDFFSPVLNDEASGGCLGTHSDDDFGDCPNRPRRTT